ncbi:MAG: EAL domain-containing protein, partial [Acidaminococcaceae bacterium]|nr:EAL domain-containing protein [Acidaminococcaceae bacterium]
MARNLEDFIKKNYKKAIERHEIQAYFQPVIRTSSRKLCSFEALARWIDPELGMIYPDEFIPVLEKERAIHRLDAAILRQACARIRSCITKGETPIPISVNLSRLDFTLCDIFSVADQVVSDYQIPHDFIYFEITESVMAEEQEMLKGIVDRFRSAGFQIWMDDFGSAYSSLNALKEFSFDEIKLDMRFLHPFNLRAKRIATAVVEMAKSIDIHTLVEGVETEEQFRYLRNVGCEKVQGYYFGKPAPYEEALARLQEKGIGTEAPHERRYYDEIGRIDFLSAVPFMTREEHDTITTARQLNSIPLALAEFASDSFSVLFYNSAFEETASGTELFSIALDQEMLSQPQPYYLLSDKLINLIDSVKTGGDGRMLFTSNEEYFEVKARCMTKSREKYCVLI